MRLGRDVQGIEGLPMVLLLGVIFGACAFGLGVKCLTQAQNTIDKQQAIESFNAFVEQAHAACMGSVGNARQVELKLSGGRMLIHDRLVQLVMDNESLKTEILPLPVLSESGGELRDGNYLLELKRATRENGTLHINDYYLGLRRF